MNPTTTIHAANGPAKPSSGGAYSGAFWERLWRTSGIQFVGFFLVTSLIYGYPPGVGAPTDALAAFYNGDRTRILIASALFSLNLLNLLWFAAALRTTLAEAGQEGWGAAATASSAVLGGLSLLSIAMGAALSYSLARSGNPALMAGLNDLAWALGVLISFPRAMLVMSGVFGLWRAGWISNTAFAVGVVAVVLEVMGGTTWLSGAWAPDGVYARFVAPGVLLIWAVGVSRVLLTRSPAARAGW